MLLNWLSSVKNLSPDPLQVLIEPVELILDLVCQLSGVTKNQDRHWLRLFFDLVECGEDENCRLAHS